MALARLLPGLLILCAAQRHKRNKAELPYFIHINPYIYSVII